MALNKDPHSQPDLQKGVSRLDTGGERLHYKEPKASISVSWGEIKVKKNSLINITTYHGRISTRGNTVLASSPHRHFANS